MRSILNSLKLLDLLKFRRFVSLRRMQGPYADQRTKANMSRTTDKKVSPGYTPVTATVPPALGQVDGRSTLYRRYKDLVGDYVDAVGGNPNATMFAIIRDAAAITAKNEEMQAQIVKGGEVDMAIYLRSIDTLIKLLSKIGIKKTLDKDSYDPSTDRHAAIILSNG